jgi:hypothetical protein
MMCCSWIASSRKREALIIGQLGLNWVESLILEFLLTIAATGGDRAADQRSRTIKG